MTRGNGLHPITSVDLTFDSEARWRFAADNADIIATHWVDAVRKNPHLWNGEMLLASDHMFDGDCLRATLLQVNFADFLYWRDIGCPAAGVVNVFGCSVLRSNDGALLMGRMGPETANAGRVYPPGGSLEPQDARECVQVDIHRSILKELREETGLKVVRDEAPIKFAVANWPTVAVCAVIEFDRSAEELRSDILQKIARMEEQELDDIVILVTVHDLENYYLGPHTRLIAEYFLS